MAEVVFRLSGVSETPARTYVRARGFDMIVDEPPSLGGDDLGPNPVEYVLAGLAGCINVVGQMVAEEMGMEIRRLEIEVRGKLNPAKFSGKSSEDRAGFKEIVVFLQVDTDASNTQLFEWTEQVESRCPVADNLSIPTPLRLHIKSAKPEAVVS